MSVFSDAELDYLGSERLRRSATTACPMSFLSPSGTTPTPDSIDIGGHDFAKRKKFRDGKRRGRGVGGR